MNQVFLDTGFLIALEASDDQHHTEAIAFWEKFRENPSPLVTTSYVLDEVVTYFNSRGHHAKAVEIGNHLMTSHSVEWIHHYFVLHVTGRIAIASERPLDASTVFVLPLVFDHSSPIEIQ